MGIVAIQKHGLEGLQRGVAKVSRHSQEIAQFGSTLDRTNQQDRLTFDESSTDVDLVESIVGLRQGEQQTYASTKILKTYDAMFKNILNIVA